MPKSGTAANPEDWRPTPPCESKVQIVGMHAESWRKGRYGNRHEFCSRPATVELNGVNLCRRHAGERLLDDLIEGRLKYEEGRTSEDGQPVSGKSGGRASKDANENGAHKG